MAVNVPDVDEFDREDLRLSPRTHKELAEMAAERGEEHDPNEYERRVEERGDEAPNLDDAEPVEGQEDRHREWLDAAE